MHSYIDHLKIDETNLWVYGATHSTTKNTSRQNTMVFKMKQDASTRQLLLGNNSSNIKWRILNGDNKMMITAISNYDDTIGS